VSAYLYTGKCLDYLKTMPSDSIDSVVTDPPYGLKFMNHAWDYDVPTTETWAEALRVLRPGGYLLAFAGTRTQHRMAVRIEDAGFEIRDMIAWVYAQGMPKSLDVSKAIDKAAGAERELTRPGEVKRDGYGGDWDTGSSSKRPRYDVPVTADAIKWVGWGTALKPSLEPITVARKPLIGTVAANVLAHGTGAINVDGCRVVRPPGERTEYGVDGNECSPTNNTYGDRVRVAYKPDEAGRYPANLIHDGSDEVTAMFPDNSPSCKPHRVKASEETVERLQSKGWGFSVCDKIAGYDDGDDLSAARFFYCAKANKKDRGEGNTHPTVKPTDLMRYLCWLVTPAGGLVLDPFMGSGTTGKAALLEGFDFIGIDDKQEHVLLAHRRIAEVASGISDE
jgi:DNA modification methylase